MVWRLILAPPVWQQQLPELVSSGNAGVARVNRNNLPGSTELVARALTPLAADTHGSDFGSLDELLLVELREQVHPEDARRTIAQFAPRSGQLVVALCLGYGPAAGRWTGTVHEYGCYCRLGELRLIGPRMQRAVVEPETVELPGDERWSRTRGALDDAVWHKIRESRVAIIGASRNGSVAAFTWAMQGVRSLVLIDPDRDELHGLDATLGATPDGIGQPKVQNRSATLQRLRPDDLEIRPLAIPFPHPRASDALRDVDLICTCVDRDAARLAAAQFANRWCKVHLDIGSGVFRTDGGPILGADVRLLLPGEACVVCLGGLRNLEEAEYEHKGIDDLLAAGGTSEVITGDAALEAARSIAAAAGVDDSGGDVDGERERPKSQATQLVELAAAGELRHTVGQAAAYTTLPVGGERGLTGIRTAKPDTRIRVSWPAGHRSRRAKNWPGIPRPS